MSSFLDDLRHNFIPRYGAIAQLIMINVGVFVVSALLGVLVWIATGSSGTFTYWYYDLLGVPSAITELPFRIWTLGTYMFAHSLGGIFHILFNMLWLYWIGRIYREYIGDQTVWSTYVMGALGGAFLFLLGYAVLPALQNVPNHPLVGASAGVMAVVVATATLVPNHTLFLMFIGPVRLKWLALIMVFLDLIMLPTSGNVGGGLAHIGGALYGLVYITLRRRGTDLAAPYNWAAGLFGGRRKRSNKGSMHVTYRRSSASTKAKPAENKDAEVDRILDKMHRLGGYDKLTKEEKQILYRASQD